jgi:hypothetical protein
MAPPVKGDAQHYLGRSLFFVFSLFLGFLLNDLLTGFGTNFLFGLCLFLRIRAAIKPANTK